jgi:uncharacterized protein
MTLSESQHSPLSAEEFAKLKSFLFSDLKGDESFSSVAMVDGYMTALAVGPEVIEPDIWIPYILNQETSDEPCTFSEADVKMLRELLVRHMETITLQFHTGADGFIPLFERVRYAGKKEKDVAIEHWAFGFTMGIELVHESWKPLFIDEETGMLVMPMLILSKITDDYKALKKDEIFDMVQLLPDFVIKIDNYWKQHKA